MPGETDLDKMLATMAPRLLDDRFVFVSFPNAQYGDHQELKPIACVLESEGLTLVIPKAQAERARLGFDSVFACISLELHSSLDAVGLTAAFANQLAGYAISANVVAGYYHDHIFVNEQDASQAILALNELAELAVEA